LSDQRAFEIFPYREEDVYKNAGTALPILRPTVDVLLERGDLSVTVAVLIDTGAPFTLFAQGVGDALGIEWSHTARRAKHTIGGGQHVAQLEHVWLTLPPFSELSWETDVGFFVDDWRMPFGGVLGHQGFLDRWAVSFNYSQNYFVVEEPGAFHGRFPPDYAEIYQSRDLGWKGGSS
jgi:hypothetical protein